VSFSWTTPYEALDSGTMLFLILVATKEVSSPAGTPIS